MKNIPTIYELRGVEWGGRAPRLSLLAEFINANMPGYHAEMRLWSGSFDRHIPGTRLRSPGKYRECKQLVVYHEGREVLKHNPIEAYRHNNDVVRWILSEIKEA